MAKKKKGQRADGLIEIARKMPDGKTRHFYGHSRAECEDKSRHSDCIINPHGCLKNQVFMRVFFISARPAGVCRCPILRLCAFETS